MPLCLNCMPFDFCRKRKITVVLPKDVTPEMATDAARFTSTLGISSGKWPHFLMDIYTNYLGQYVHPITHKGVDLDIEHLFRSPDQVELDDDLDPDSPIQFKENRTWYRDNFSRGRKIHSISNPNRWAVAITILRSRYVEARVWGIQAENDNLPPVDPKCG